MTYNILKILEKGNNRIMADQVVQAIINEPSNMPDLMDCFLSSDMRISQLASWPIGLLGEREPELLGEYLPELIESMNNAPHDAITRSSLKALQHINIPEEIEGPLFEIAYAFLNEPKKAIAIRVFAMTVCVNIAKNHKFLAEELQQCIEGLYPHGSVGFKARARKELKELKKIRN